MVVIHRSKRPVLKKGSLLTSLTGETASSEEAMAGRVSEPVSPYSQPEIFLVLEDIKRGVLPSNQQLLKWLAAFRSSGLLTASPSLSPSGQRLVTDIAQLMTLLERLLRERNADELFQRLIYHASLSARLSKRDLGKRTRWAVVRGPRRRLYFGGSRDARIMASRQQLRARTRDSARTLWQALILVLTSADFRQVLTHGRRLLARLMGQPVGPSSMEMNGTANVFQDVYETPHAKLFVPKHRKSSVHGVADSALVQDELRSLHSQIAATHDQLERIQTGESDMDEKENAASFSRVDNAAARDKVHNRREDVEELEVDEEAFMAEFRELASKISAGRFLPAFGTLWQVLSQLGSVDTSAPQWTDVLPPELRYDANLRAAQRDMLAILERFSPGADVTALLKAVRTIREQASQDYELKDFVGDWRAFAERCVRDKRYMQHDEFRSRSHFLLSRTSEIFRQRYREQFWAAYSQAQALLSAWDQDELLRDISACTQRIVRDDILGQTTTNEAEESDVESTASTSMMVPFAGLRVINTDLLRDFRSVILPNALRSLTVVPFPRIEAERDGTRLVLENIVLPADALLPVDLAIKSRTHLQMHPKQHLLQHFGPGQRTSLRNGTVVHMGAFRAHIPNVKFAVDRVGAFPRFRDAGLLDVTIGGKGLNVVINIEAAAVPTTPNALFNASPDGGQQAGRLQLHPHYVRVHIDRLKMRFHGSNHDGLYAVAAPFIQLATKRAIELAIAERIVQAIDFTDRLMLRVSRQQYFG